uniref:DUF2970 domain-containing protein n=1 Tax=uncultured Thiotrichaceae bacterium TaxID=298394 RepID=A0A6S6U9M2_9GAMM|nr:MAG: Unknown protein [uncultured Thiotrichaceae bacterium]
MQQEQDQTKEKKVTPWSIFVSALAGLGGVQNKENLERDFKSGKFWHFFIAGGIVTLLFMLAVWGAVQLLLSTTT